MTPMDVVIITVMTANPNKTVYESVLFMVLRHCDKVVLTIGDRLICKFDTGGY